MFSVSIFNKKTVFVYATIALFLYSAVTYLSQINIQSAPVDLDYWTNIGMITGFITVGVLVALKFNNVMQNNLLQKKEGYEKLDLIAKRLSVGIVTYNKTYLTYTNDFVQTLSGYTKGELLRIPFIKLIHPEDRAVMVERLAAGTRSSENILNTGHEYRLLRKDGTVRWVYITTVVYTKEKPYFGVSGVVDIQRLKELEYQNLKMKKSESLVRFAGGLAHELNNDLAVLTGSISLVSLFVKRRQIDKAEDVLIRIKEAADEVGKVMRRMIHFAKGGVLQKRTRVVLCNVIHDALAKFSLEYPSVTLTTEIDGVIGETLINIGEIEEVILGMLRNSAEAAGGKCRIVVTAETFVLSGKTAMSNDALNTGEYIKVIIRDNGPGIKESDISRVFDPYYSSKESGKGVGLSMALSVMRLHGGTLTLDSKEGEGVTVTLYFPVVPASEEEKNGTLP